MSREVPRAFADEAGELCCDAPTEVRVIRETFDCSGFQELAHSDYTAYELIGIDFFLPGELTHPEVLLTKVVHDSHTDVREPSSFDNRLFLQHVSLGDQGAAGSEVLLG